MSLAGLIERYVNRWRKRMLQSAAVTVLLACSMPIVADETVTEPYVILVSIDGYRYDYPDLFSGPALGRIAREGVRARSLRPVWPTLTFPNHYSIATGLYPAQHGLLGNRFPAADGSDAYNYRDRRTVQDGKWYGGEPLWVAAERAGLPTAAFYFVGTEAPVDGISPSDWRPFDADVDGGARVEQVLEWLARPSATRPRLITLYFEHVDVASHRYGPATPQVAAAIAQVDEWIGQLQAGIDALPIAGQVNIAVVSDHGQVATRTTAEPLVLDEIIDLGGITVIEHGSVVKLYLDTDDPFRARRVRDAINQNWQHGRAWLPHEAPRYWHVNNAAGIADVLVQADPGFVAVSTRAGADSLTTGDHGWSPGARDMHGIFMAAGPAWPAGVTVATIDAVDIYPALLAILGLPDKRPQAAPSPLLEVLR